ncbi:MAG: ATP-binding protein [Bacillota bacterium]|nr:ATP-binding protein [Bacillota bacterium]
MWLHLAFAAEGGPADRGRSSHPVHEIEFRRGSAEFADLAEAVVCLANHRRGWVLLGVDDRGRITGCDHEVGLLKRAIFDSTQPPHRGCRGGTGSRGPRPMHRGARDSLGGGDGPGAVRAPVGDGLPAGAAHCLAPLVGRQG